VCKARGAVDLLIGVSFEDAFVVQPVQVAHRVATGRRVVGDKVGLTSAAARRDIGVDCPNRGRLLGDMRVTGGTVRSGWFLAPEAEPEVAFVLDLVTRGPGASMADAVNLRSQPVSTSLAWLASSMGGRGARPEAGQVVLSGATTSVIPLVSGRTTCARVSAM
jgi:2-keto-4-pentenoate hydratase